MEEVNIVKCYSIIGKDPRYLDLLAKYAPELSSVSGAAQKGRIALHPSHIPVFGIFAKLFEAVEAGKSSKSIGAASKSLEQGISVDKLDSLDVTVGEEADSYLEKDLENMLANCKAFHARKTTRVTLSVAFMPLGGFVWWPLRKSLEKGAEKGTEAKEHLNHDSIMAKYWATKAFLIYIGLPTTENHIYDAYEKSRLTLKALYGCLPEEDLEKMKPNKEKRKMMHKMEKDGGYDLEKLEIPLLVVLWHAYYCWDLLCWDRLVNTFTTKKGKERSKKQREKEHGHMITKDLTEKNPHVKKFDNFDQLKSSYTDLDIDRSDNSGLVAMGMDTETRAFLSNAVLGGDKKWAVQKLWKFTKGEGEEEKLAGFVFLDQPGEAPSVKISKFYGPGRKILKKVSVGQFNMLLFLQKKFYSYQKAAYKKEKNGLNIIHRIAADSDEGIADLLSVISTHSSVPTLFICSRGCKAIHSILEADDAWKVKDSFEFKDDSLEDLSCIDEEEQKAACHFDVWWHEPDM